MPDVPLKLLEILSRIRQILAVPEDLSVQIRVIRGVCFYAAGYMPKTFTRSATSPK